MTSLADPITLATVEPVAIAGLAVTLACLALDRFRYRGEIEYAARQCYNKFCTNEQINSQKGLGVWNEVLWLNRKPSNGFKPTGFMGGLYKRIFREVLDFYVIVFLAIVSGLALTIGVALGLQTWTWLAPVNARDGVIIVFYLCVVAILLPPVLIYGGHRCRVWGVDRANYCDGQLELFLAQRATLVESPVGKVKEPD